MVPDHVLCEIAARHGIDSRNMAAVKKFFAQEGDGLTDRQWELVANELLVRDDEPSDREGTWTLDWVRDKVYLGQKGHLLVKYLFGRTEGMAKKHDAAGYDVNRILRDGFEFRTAQIRVLAGWLMVRFPEVDVSLVWEIVKSPHLSTIQSFEKLFSRLPVDRRRRYPGVAQEISGAIRDLSK